MSSWSGRESIKSGYGRKLGRNSDGGRNADYIYLVVGWEVGGLMAASKFEAYKTCPGYLAALARAQAADGSQWRIYGGDHFACAVCDFAGVTKIKLPDGEFEYRPGGYAGCLEEKPESESKT